ncbi:ankyrin [Aspergillus lentulus]|nr:ankyrin [Aspergillus lentulus]
MTLDVAEEIIHKTMDDMLYYLNPDGLVYLYFDSTRPYIDPFISANMLGLFYRNGRGSNLIATCRFMEDMLRTRAYEHGSRYYHLPDFLPYYLSDICVHNRGEQDLHALDGRSNLTVDGRDECIVWGQDPFQQRRFNNRFGRGGIAWRHVDWDLQKTKEDATVNARRWKIKTKRNVLQDENYGLYEYHGGCPTYSPEQ